MHIDHKIYEMSMWMITPIKCIMLISESKITSGTNVRFVIQVRLLETTAHALLLPTHYPDLVEYHTHTHTLIILQFWRSEV